ncbi:hypothetical protein ACFPYI_21000 [Halomarina salina]|uniref:ArsR family transcriptional regulator n=1 Tax=Halomarina salina TaxID=1872699 RepID=A0ABD5RT97_9EURY|nr:hypothetical protein [Halomarina salina]
MNEETSVGRPPRVTDADIIEVFARAETPVLTTSMVAEELPIGSRATLDRLKGLREKGDLDSMDVGSRAQVWWVPEDDSSSADDFEAGFGAFAGTDFAERAREVEEKFNEDAKERDALSR